MSSKYVQGTDGRTYTQMLVMGADGNAYPQWVPASTSPPAGGTAVGLYEQSRSMLDEVA